MGLDDPTAAVRGECVALGSDRTAAESLQVAVFAHAGVSGQVVEAPLVGVALDLPEYADPREIAQAIHSERVTAGFLDFQGRACVAVPADTCHIDQAAHAVAKVVHYLLELHTPFIDVQSDACPDVASLPWLDDAAALTQALAVLTTASLLQKQVSDLLAVQISSEMLAIVDEALVLVADTRKMVQERLASPSRPTADSA